MKYNERLINTYGSKELQDLLANPSRYKSIIIDRYSRDKKDCKSSDLAIIDALDNYIIKMATTNPYGLNRDNVRAYRDFLYNAQRTHPNVCLDSILFKKENLNLIFSNDQINHISNTKKDIYKKCVLELQTLIKKPNQTASNELLRFAEVQIGNDSERSTDLLESLYTYLLNNQSTNSNFYAREFILKYTAYNTAKELEIPPVEVYVSNYGLDGNILGSGNLGTSYSNTSIINVSKDYVLDKKGLDDSLPSIVNLLQTITHEVKHSRQAYHASNNMVTMDAFIYIRRNLFNKYLKYTNTCEYNINYLHNEIENDSNYYGWRQVENIIEKYAPSLAPALGRVVSNSIVTAFQPSTATKVIEENNKRRRLPKDKFNVDNMDKIIRDNPSVLNEYPLLRKIYHSNGVRRSFIERLKIEQSTTGDDKSNLEKIYSEFNTRDFHDGVVEKIDVGSLDVDMQFCFFNKIFSMAYEEAKHLKEGFKVFGVYTDAEKLRSEEFMKVSVYRARRLTKYVEYINSNKDLIQKLDVINLKRAIDKSQPFTILLGYVADEIKSVKKYISKFKDKHSNDEEKDKMLAELSSLEQAEVFISENRK